jgi:hypothetical protein
MLERAVKTLVSASDPVYSSLSQSSAAGKSSPQLPALSNASFPPPEFRDIRFGPAGAASPPVEPAVRSGAVDPDADDAGLFHVSILPENAAVPEVFDCISGFG